MDAQPPIKRIGYFHFGKDYTSPIPSLEAQLKERRQVVADSLIVLPEAFNISKVYNLEQPYSNDPTVLLQLQRLSGMYQVSFVAGLIIQTPNGPTPPYSSAYLIDASGFGLMCHKQCPDDTGNAAFRPHNYTPCVDGCDAHNAIPYRNLCLTTLICVDATNDGRFPDNKKRHEQLRRKMELCGVEKQVICIPLCMNCTESDSENIAASWPVDYYVVMPNSKGMSSIVMGVEDYGKRSCSSTGVAEATNTIELFDIGNHE